MVNLLFAYLLTAGPPGSPAWYHCYRVARYADPERSEGVRILYQLATELFGGGFNLIGFNWFGSKFLRRDRNRPDGSSLSAILLERIALTGLPEGPCGRPCASVNRPEGCLLAPFP